MASGISFLDILLREGTMVLGVLIFLFCGALLLLRRRSLHGLPKGLAVAALVVTGLYLAGIVGLAILWGQQMP